MRMRRVTGRDHLPEQDAGGWQRLTDGLGIVGHGQTWITFGYSTLQPWYAGPYRQDVPKRGGRWVHGR
jgi:hypothetical protein